MAFLKLPKTAEDAKEMMDEIPKDELENLTGIQKIIHHLKKGEWAAMVGAIMAVWKEYFGSDAEKSELAKSKKEAEEETVKADTHEGLAALQEEVETEPEAEEEDADEAQEDIKEDVELPEGSDIVAIGDSIMKGMRARFAQGKQPDLIGDEGYSSMKTLETLRSQKDRLAGKRKALIYTGGNNVGYSPPENIVKDMISMAKMCDEAGVPEIVVCTRFPNDPRRKSKMTEKSMALREALIKAHQEGRFPGSVKLVDLYRHFADENGELKQQYVRTKSKDYIHPRGAYSEALKMMLSEEEEKLLS